MSIPEKVFADHLVPWIKFKGEVEIRCANDTFDPVDLLRYIEEDEELKRYEGEFDPDFFKKNKNDGSQNIVYCIVCKSEQKQWGTLLNHLQGAKHVRKANEFRRIQQGLPKDPPHQPKIKRAKIELPPARDAMRIPLAELLQKNHFTPALGLEYIHEYSNPRNPNDPVRLYTCRLKGCKSAWGKSDEMAQHLIGKKGKHNVNYCLHIKKMEGVKDLTIDKQVAKFQEVDREERGFDQKQERDYTKINRHYDDLEMYLELKNRPLEWSEDKALRKRATEERKKADAQCVEEILRSVKSSLRSAKRALEEPSYESEKHLKDQAEAILASIDLGLDLAERNAGGKETSSQVSCFGHFREQVLDIRRQATFSVEVTDAVHDAALPYFVNADDPAMVRIPSRAKFDWQVEKMAGKIKQGERTRDKLPKFNVEIDDRVSDFVKRSMERFPPLLDL